MYSLGFFKMVCPCLYDVARYSIVRYPRLLLVKSMFVEELLVWLKLLSDKWVLRPFAFYDN